MSFLMAPSAYTTWSTMCLSGLLLCPYSLDLDPSGLIRWLSPIALHLLASVQPLLSALPRLFFPPPCAVLRESS